MSSSSVELIKQQFRYDSLKEVSSKIEWISFTTIIVYTWTLIFNHMKTYYNNYYNILCKHY